MRMADTSLAENCISANSITNTTDAMLIQAIGLVYPVNRASVGAALKSVHESYGVISGVHESWRGRGKGTRIIENECSSSAHNEGFKPHASGRRLLCSRLCFILHSFLETPRGLRAIAFRASLC